MLNFNQWQQSLSLLPHGYKNPSLQISISKRAAPVVQTLDNAIYQAAVVQTLDSAIHRIRIYPVDSAIGFPNTYPMDSDLSGG